ncbi:MAG: hypothetical protein UH854_05835 [Clostridia bacterium]|nr:hypothetical protein [Clostridia bacterium]
MKKTANIITFIIIIGFVGSWECGNSDFKTLLFNTGITLSLLLSFHTLRIIFEIIKILKRPKRINVKIS